MADHYLDLQRGQRRDHWRRVGVIALLFAGGAVLLGLTIAGVVLFVRSR